MSLPSLPRFLAAGLCVVFVAACGSRKCLDLACTSTLSVKLDTSLVAGTYQLTVAAAEAGVNEACEIVVTKGAMSASFFEVTSTCKVLRDFKDTGAGIGSFEVSGLTEAQIRGTKSVSVRIASGTTVMLEGAYPVALSEGPASDPECGSSNCVAGKVVATATK